MQAPHLIDRAKYELGTYANVAAALGVSAQRLSEWKGLHRNCPDSAMNKLCVIACLTDAEIAAHVAERAGMKRKPRATFITASVAAFAGSLATAIALFVAPDTNRTALKPAHPNV